MGFKKFKTYFLKVDKYHELYIEETGNKKGIPIICLHGGPGAPTRYLEFIPLNKYRIINFHQRGCGFSKYKKQNQLKNNQTKYIIQDIHKIKLFLNIKKKWVVIGASWGASLGFLYGIYYPLEVKKLVLCGISLFDNFVEHSSKKICPKMYKKWKVKKNDYLTTKYYFNEIKKGNKKAIKMWRDFEDKCMDKDKFPSIKSTKKISFKYKNITREKFNYDISLLESYYYLNKGFLNKNMIKLSKQLKKKKFPITLIHGKYDGVCSLSNSQRLKKSLPYIVLKITNQGHSMGNTENAKETKKALKIK